MNLPIAIILCFSIVGSGAVIIFNLVGSRAVYDYWSLDADDLPKSGKLAFLRSAWVFGIAMAVMLASVVMYVELR
jgi:hypothetical protein